MTWRGPRDRFCPFLFRLVFVCPILPLLVNCQRLLCTLCGIQAQPAFTQSSMPRLLLPGVSPPSFPCLALPQQIETCGGRTVRHETGKSPLHVSAVSLVRSPGGLGEREEWLNEMNGQVCLPIPNVGGGGVAEQLIGGEIAGRFVPSGWAATVDKSKHIIPFSAGNGCRALRRIMGRQPKG